MKITVPAKSLPIVKNCDVLITGSSLAGIAAAVETARSSAKVHLIDSRTYFGTDLCAGLGAGNSQSSMLHGAMYDTWTLL